MSIFVFHSVHAVRLTRKCDDHACAVIMLNGKRVLPLFRQAKSSEMSTLFVHEIFAQTSKLFVNSSAGSSASQLV
jgi:hypothetical protein